MKLSSGVDMSSCWRLATEGNKLAVRRFYHQHFLHRIMTAVDDGTQFEFILGDQLFWNRVDTAAAVSSLRSCSQRWVRISLWDNHESEWVRISLWDNHPMIIIMMIIQMMITRFWVCFISLEIFTSNIYHTYVECPMKITLIGVKIPKVVAALPFLPQGSPIARFIQFFSQSFIFPLFF